ncbi:MAG: hypothetical protein H6807_06570 [Planctomycetes bacterium]|nr:hypothetical protein [Planctomycetota bacterium]
MRCLFVSTILCLALTLQAQETTSTTDRALATAVEETAESGIGISGNLGLDCYTHYFFRGIIQENDDLILQPSVGVNLRVLEHHEDWLSSVDIGLGLWNSLHWGPTGADGGGTDPELWYEADFTASLSFGFFDTVTLGLSYVALTSPNDFFGTVEELDIALAYDDAELWGGDFGGLQPSATLVFELDGQSDGGQDEGVYLELGIAPGFTLLEDETYPITIKLPVKVGLSLSDYYEVATSDDDAFGYLDFGVDLAVPLAFIDQAFGAWELGAGVHGLYLGDNTRIYNSGDEFEVYGFVGISVSF